MLRSFIDRKSLFSKLYKIFLISIRLNGFEINDWKLYFSLHDHITATKNCVEINQKAF